MAVQNSLVKNDAKRLDVQFDSGGTQVFLSPTIVKNYLVSGNGNVSDQEVVMFIKLCQAQKLNPFLREAYLIKYGSQPATMVTGKEVFTKRAQRNPRYEGHEAGVIVLNDDSELIERAGTLILEDEKLVGGWAKVHIKGYKIPIEMAVTFTEYCLYKDGKPASNWAVKPATMIRKVALVQALREAFPEDLQGMYDQDEMMVDAPLSDVPIVMENDLTHQTDEPAHTEIPETAIVNDPLA